MAAPDGALFDDAPGVETHRITESERATFEHAVSYRGDAVVLTDRRATSILTDYYDSPTRTLRIPYGDVQSMTRPALVVDRAYIHSPHAQYDIVHRGDRFTVHGAVPIDEIQPWNRSTVYTTGTDELTAIS